MNDTRLFAFESDFVASLRCVPMAVRFKLDLCGVKLSLRQWSRFTLDERQGLRLSPCDRDPEIAAYRDRLTRLILERTGERPTRLSLTRAEISPPRDRTPKAVAAFAASAGLGPPHDADWSRLSSLQRFALMKLTRDNHDNINFAPAMREFGLAQRLVDARHECEPAGR